MIVQALSKAAVLLSQLEVVALIWVVGTLLVLLPPLLLDYFVDIPFPFEEEELFY